MWFFRQTGLKRQELQTGFKLRSAIDEARTPPAQRGRYKRLVTFDKRYLNAVSATGHIHGHKLSAWSSPISLISGAPTRSLINPCFW